MGSIPERVASLEKSYAATESLFNLYTRLYQTVVAREVALAEITQDDTILNVGCGAMPFTAALLARETDATVYALDRDVSIQNKARRNLERAGVGDTVEVIIGDGQSVLGNGAKLPSSCSVAVLALQTGPKDAIISQYRQTQDSPDRIVARQPRSLFSTSYDAVTEHEPTRVTTHWMPTFDQSLLFEES